MTSFPTTPTQKQEKKKKNVSEETAFENAARGLAVSVHSNTIKIQSRFEKIQIMVPNLDWCTVYTSYTAHCCDTADLHESIPNRKLS